MARNNFEARTYTTAPENVIEIFVDAQYMPVYASAYDGTDLIIEYYTSSDFEYMARLDNGIITLTCPQVRHEGVVGGMFGMFLSSISGINWSDLAINIRVPRSYRGMLNLCTSDAKVSVMNIELGSRLHAITSNAEVELRGVLATAFELTSNNGKIIADNAAAYGEPDASGVARPTACKAVTSNAAIDLTSFSTLGDFTCKTSNASIKLRDTAIQGSLSCVSSNGSISTSNTSVQGAAHFKSSNASIKPERLLARDIEFVTSNGSIKGSIVGQYSDFSVESQTSNGKNNLPSSATGAGRRLTARTSNGSISLEFVH